MKRVFILCSLLVLPILLLSRELPDVCEVSIPQKLNRDIVSERTTFDLMLGKLSMKSSTGNYWDVWSDREGNVAYNSPDVSSGKRDVLKFNERVRIARIDKGFAQVYVEPKNVPFPEISNAAEYKGWVPMRCLLLWHSCPVNEYNIYNKALIAINVDATGDVKDVGHRYSNPQTRSVLGEIRTDMSFYFVMKSENDMSLLANSCSMDGSSDQVLYGWVSNKAFTSWNQRSCLEPNWNLSDMSELKGMQLNVFRNMNLTEVTTTYRFGELQSGFEGENRYRLPPEALRYPILDADGQNEGVFKCTVFGTPQGGMAAAARAKYELEKQRNGIIHNLQHVNIILVIDGTSSMKKFYNPVSRAIKEGCAYFTDNHYDVRVGAVIYRDHPDGKYVTEVYPMTKSGDKAFANFLDSGGEYGIRSVARSMTEALYKGIDDALDAERMGYSPREANLMLVIGDCGNDEKDKAIAESSLLEKLQKNHFQMMTFQVNFRNLPAYRAFDEQMNRLMYKNIKTSYDGITGVKRVPTEGGFNIVSNVDGVNFYISAGRRPAQDQEMKFSLLEQLIEGQIAAYAKSVGSQVNAVSRSPQDIANGLSSENVNTEHVSTIQIESKFLQKTMDPEFLKWVVQSNSMLSFTGYTPVKNTSGRDLWKTVLYISDAEFKDMMSRLKPLYTAARQGNYKDRKPYLDALKGLIKGMLPDLTDAQMAQMNLEDILKMVKGLNVTTETMTGGGHKLSKLDSMKDADYRSILTRFVNQYERLNRLMEGQYDFAMVEKGTKYYWIPIEYLP